MARLAEIQIKLLPHILDSRKPSETLRETSRHVSRHGFPGVPLAHRVEIDMTWSATQVGLGPVESGLGGHDDRGFWVDEGVEKTSLPL